MVRLLTITKLTSCESVVPTDSFTEVQLSSAAIVAGAMASGSESWYDAYQVDMKCSGWNISA